MSTQPPRQDGSERLRRSVSSRIVRPLYSPGLILEDSDLTTAVDYTRDLSRLLFRSLFGCGVVCGLTVSVTRTEFGLDVTVQPGLALNGCGDPIHLVEPVTIKLEERDGVVPASAPADPNHQNFWVLLRGGEETGAPRELVADTDDFDGLTQRTRLRASAIVSIVFEPPKCLCRCKADPPDFGEEAPVIWYRRETDRLLAEDKSTECHKNHYDRIDCAPDGGCGGGCDCECDVLLARVHWFNGKNAWGAIHRGERRFLRPTFGSDPVKDQRP